MITKRVGLQVVYVHYGPVDERFDCSMASIFNQETQYPLDVLILHDRYQKPDESYDSGYKEIQEFAAAHENVRVFQPEARRKIPRKLMYEYAQHCRENGQPFTNMKYFAFLDSGDYWPHQDGQSFQIDQRLQFLETYTNIAISAVPTILQPDDGSQPRMIADFQGAGADTRLDLQGVLSLKDPIFARPHASGCIFRAQDCDDNGFFLPDHLARMSNLGYWAVQVEYLKGGKLMYVHDQYDPSVKPLIAGAPSLFEKFSKDYLSISATLAVTEDALTKGQFREILETRYRKAVQDLVDHHGYDPKYLTMP